MDIHIKLARKLLQLVKEYLIVGVGTKNLLPLVSPVDDMIACPGIFHS
jgi:hypothetical protein